MSIIRDIRELSAYRRELRDSLENPAIALSSDSIISILPGGRRTDAGVNVSELTAMRSAAIWRCVQIVAGSIAQLQLRTFTPTAVGGRREVATPVLRAPYPGLTPYDLWELVMVHLLLWGNAYLLKIRDEADVNVVRLLPLNPWAVTVLRTQPTPGSAWGSKRFVVSGAPHALTDDDVMHIPGIGYDGIRGLSPIASASQGIGVGMAAEEYAARLFGSGSLQGGVLQSDRPILEDHAEKLKARWRDKIGGLSRAHEIAVLDAGVKFIPTTIAPEQAQFLQTRDFAILEAARLFGVPPHLLMQVDKTTSWGAGITEQTAGFVRYTLSFWAARIAQHVTMHLLSGDQEAEFDMDPLLRGTQTERFANYNAAIQNHWMTPAEARNFERLEPRADCADIFTPLSTPAPPAQAPMPERPAPPVRSQEAP